MAEILDLVIEFFRVQDFANNYSNPLDQFLYAIFFPSILLIILIYLLTKRIFPEHGGISVLLGVSFYIFVIVYPPNAATSLYGAFAPIGTVWYIGVILIGLLYILLGRILPTRKGEGGGAGGGKGYAIPEIMRERMQEELSEIELQNRIKNLEDDIKQIEKRHDISEDVKRSRVESLQIKLTDAKNTLYVVQKEKGLLRKAAKHAIK